MNELRGFVGDGSFFFYMLQGSVQRRRQAFGQLDRQRERCKLISVGLADCLEMNHHSLGMEKLFLLASVIAVMGLTNTNHLKIDFFHLCLERFALRVASGRCVSKARVQ